jgi:hypothetical protein
MAGLHKRLKVRALVRPRLATSFFPPNRFLCSINFYKYGLWEAGTSNKVVVSARQNGNRFCAGASVPVLVFLHPTVVQVPAAVVVPAFAVNSAAADIPAVVGVLAVAVDH